MWWFGYAYLVEVDDWLPEVVLLLVEISHTNLSEVTWMVLVQVGTVMVLTTSKTTSTWMLAVLADTSLTGGNMSAAMKNVSTVYDNISNEAEASPRRSPSVAINSTAAEEPFSGFCGGVVVATERTQKSTRPKTRNATIAQSA